MELAAILVILLLLSLALSQAWLLWFLRREVARLDHRVDESLDAEDLVEFQEQLQGLLEQVKDAGLELAQSLELRHSAVEKAVEECKDAELKLAGRLLAMDKLADKMSQRLKQAEAASGAAPARAPQRPAAKERARPEERPFPAPSDGPPALPEAPKAETPPEPAADAAARGRSYLSRPAVQPRHQRVYELADQGWSREQIAKEAGLLPGEVDLILNLRRQRPAQG